MHGFQEDVADWQATLDPDERMQMLRQWQGALGKKFKKSPEGKKKLPAEKMKSFSNVLRTFLDAQKDMGKDVARDDVDKDFVKKAKAAAGNKELTLAGSVIPIDLDQHRFARGCKYVTRELREQGIKFTLENEEYVRRARQYANMTREWYRTQYKRDLSTITKADIMKEIHAYKCQTEKTPPPPLDPEMLQAMRNEKALPEGKPHSWGVAHTVYQSVAKDSFGDEYLLGIFDTEAEAQRAHEQWIAEFDQVQRQMKEDLRIFAKQEDSRLAAEDVALQKKKYSR